MEKGELNAFDMFNTRDTVCRPRVRRDVDGGCERWFEKVKEARHLETDFLKVKHGVYVTRPRTVRFEKTG